MKICIIKKSKMKTKYLCLLLIFIVLKTQAQNIQYAEGSATDEQVETQKHSQVSVLSYNYVTECRWK